MVQTPVKFESPSYVAQPQTVGETEKWVSEGLGLSAMPECPIEAFKAWGERKAKRPCYWDEAKQKVVGVSWKQYQDKRPTLADKTLWYASPLTQIGCLGGWNGKHWLSWIDFDLQHFENKQALDAKLTWWETKYTIGGLAPKFRSPSGGYRYLVAFNNKPDKFGANSGFSFTPGNSERLGELLTNNGGHTLLPPTVSYNGAYEWERWSEYPPVVDSPQDIGLYPVGKKATESKPKAPRTQTSYTPGAIHLDQMLCPKAKDILTNGAKKGNRSDALAALANEIYGWVNWLNQNSISFNSHPEELIESAWSRMEDADSDADKWQRAIEKIVGDISLMPAAHYKGDDEACWKKIKSVDKATFEEKCPTAIKEALRISGRQSGRGGNNSPKPVKPRNGSQGDRHSNTGDSGGGIGDGGDWDGGSDGFEPENDGWNAPQSWNGQIGWWVIAKDENGKKIPGAYNFIPQCNFDFQVECELESVDPEDGGALVLQIKRAFDSEQKRVIIKSVDYTEVATFTNALKKALGKGIVCNLKKNSLGALIHTRLKDYKARGGKTYRLIDRFGQQEDGTWVFENKQFTEDGQPINPEESDWVFTPNVGKGDTFFCPEILDENPTAIRNLIEAQKKVAGSNFILWLLCDGHVAACLNERAIVKAEGFMPILNPYGDPGGGKTIAAKSAMSLVWGNSPKAGMCSATESYLYERLRRYGSIPSLWDDPPSKRREDKERLDEFIKRNYGKFPRIVRGSNQQPHSSFIPTTNHGCGDTLSAAKTRTINAFFPVIGDMNMDFMPELEEAKRQATGAFRSIISIGYQQTEVKQMSKRLQKHLPTAHDRAAIHLAILTWYTQKVVDLAGMGIDVEAWVIQNLCPDLNEAQTGLNSIADFFERFLAASSIRAIGSWNSAIVHTSDYGRCLAVHMPSVWTEIERSADPPSYNRSVLERVLVEKGAIKNKPAKLDRDKDSALAYQREIHKGRNEGESWVPPSKPKPVNKKCILIPERLWGDLEITPLIKPDPPPGAGDNFEDDDDLVTSGNLEVTSSNQQEVTTSILDKSMVLDDEPKSGNLVTKKYIEEEEKLVELKAPTQNNTQQHQWNSSSSDDVELEQALPLQNLVTRLPETVDESETLENTGVEAVTNQGYSEVTEVKKKVTSEVTAPDFSFLIARTNAEMKRLGWSNQQGKDYLLKTKGKRSRQLLTDAELRDFLHHLESLEQIASTSAEQVPSAIAKAPTVAANQPVEEDQWVVGQQVVVDTDIRSLQDFNGRQGVVEAVNLSNCLIKFGEGEFMYIPFRGLKRIG